MLNQVEPRNIHYRAIPPEDGSPLWDLLYYALYVPQGKPPLPRSVLQEPQVAAYANAWGREGDAGFFAWHGDRLIGGVWMRLWPGPIRGYGYVDDRTPEISLAVLSEYRNQGIGTALLNRMVSLAAHEYPALCLSVSADNPAVRLYRRFGFSPIPSSDSHTLIMVKYL